jgi:hypothetical protein
VISNADRVRVTVNELAQLLTISSTKWQTNTGIKVSHAGVNLIAYPYFVTVP